MTTCILCRALHFFYCHPAVSVQPHEDDLKPELKLIVRNRVLNSRCLCRITSRRLVRISVTQSFTPWATVVPNSNSVKLKARCWLVGYSYMYQYSVSRICHVDWREQPGFRRFALIVTRLEMVFAMKRLKQSQTLMRKFSRFDWHNLIVVGHTRGLLLCWSTFFFGGGGGGVHNSP